MTRAKPTMPTKIKSFTMIALLFLFAAWFGSFATGAIAQVSPQSVFQTRNFGRHLDAEQSRQFDRRRMAEERAVVGEPFPPSLKAYDVAGNAVAIRDLLHGPAVVIQLFADSSISDEILAYLREHGLDYSKKHHVQVVVVATDPYGQYYRDMLRDLPKGIVALHVTGPLTLGLHQNPILGGSVAPVTLFLNKSLVVIDRHLGTYGKPEETLTSTDAFK